MNTLISKPQAWSSNLKRGSRYMSISKIGLHELSMLQLSDSFFPTGMYSMSNGLEALFYSNRKMKAEELRDLLKTLLEYQIGPADCTALANAYEYAAKFNLAKLLEVDRVIFSMKLVQEIRDASIRSGTQLVRC